MLMHSHKKEQKMKRKGQKRDCGESKRREMEERCENGHDRHKKTRTVVWYKTAHKTTVIVLT